MNPGLPAGSQRAQRLTTLIYTDASPLLPLPSVPDAADTDGHFDAGADRALAQDETFLDHAARLLAGVDLSHM